VNEERRKSLDRVLNLIEDAKSIVDEMKGLEEEALESLPESMQSGDKGEKMQVTIDALSEAYDNLETALEHINTAKE
jgi:NifU-like protein involved in Fe-S cluster formation